MKKYWRAWIHKKWTLWCELEGLVHQYPETDCENVFRTLNHWRRVFDLRKFATESQLGCATRPFLTWMMVWDRTPACREYAHPRADKDSRAYAAIPWRTWIGPVIQVHIIQNLGNHGLAIQIQSPTNPDRKSWVVICGGKNRCADELHLQNPGHNLTSSELLSERAIAKEGEPCSAELEQSRIEETHATQFKSPTDPVYYTKEISPVRERKWNDIPACQSFNGDSLQSGISKLVMRVRH